MKSPKELRRLADVIERSEPMRCLAATDHLAKAVMMDCLHADTDLLTLCERLATVLSQARIESQTKLVEHLQRCTCRAFPIGDWPKEEPSNA